MKSELPLRYVSIVIVTSCLDQSLDCENDKWIEIQYFATRLKRMSQKIRFIREQQQTFDLFLEETLE